MKYIDVTTAISLLRAVSDEISRNKLILCDIDSKTGDGDHGLGMAKGMEAACQKIEKMSETDNVYDIFAEFGKIMMATMGGASGIIFGSMFNSGAKEMTKSERMSTSDFTEMMEKSLIKIVERGKAKVGDKTMVDALFPAVHAMKKVKTKDFEILLSVSEEASKTGLESTIPLQSKVGRSKSLLERSIGYQDAGATSVYLIFSAMHSFIVDSGKKL